MVPKWKKSTKKWYERFKTGLHYNFSAPVQSGYLRDARAQKIPTRIAQGNHKDILAMLYPIQGDTACPDPGFFLCLCVCVCVWGGGGGGSRPLTEKKLWCLFVFVFFLVLQQGSIGLFKENYTFPKFQKRSDIFQGVGNFFQGVQMLISIETYSLELVIFCGGGGGGGGVWSPYPPLDSHRH